MGEAKRKANAIKAGKITDKKSRFISLMKRISKHSGQRIQRFANIRFK
jgi:hypothetical protein